MRKCGEGDEAHHYDVTVANCLIEGQVSSNVLSAEAGYQRGHALSPGDRVVALCPALVKGCLPGQDVFGPGKVPPSPPVCVRVFIGRECGYVLKRLPCLYQGALSMLWTGLSLRFSAIIRNFLTDSGYCVERSKLYCGVLVRTT